MFMEEGIVFWDLWEIGANLFSSSEDPTRYIPRYKPLDISRLIMTI